MALGECLLFSEEQNLDLAIGAGNTLAVGVFLCKV